MSLTKSAKLPIPFQTSNKFAPTQIDFQKYSMILKVRGAGIVIDFQELEEIYAFYLKLKEEGIACLPD